MFRNLYSIPSGKQTPKMLSIRQFMLNTKKPMKNLYYQLQPAQPFRELNCRVMMRLRTRLGIPGLEWLQFVCTITPPGYLELLQPESLHTSFLFGVGVPSAALLLWSCHRLLQLVPRREDIFCREEQTSQPLGSDWKPFWSFHHPRNRSEHWQAEQLQWWVLIPLTCFPACHQLVK